MVPYNWDGMELNQIVWLISIYLTLIRIQSNIVDVSNKLFYDISLWIRYNIKNNKGDTDKKQEMRKLIRQNIQ